MATNTQSNTTKPAFYGEYWKANSGQWYFHIRSRNHKVVAASEGYKAKGDAVKIIERMGFTCKEIGDPNRSKVDR